MIGLIGKKIGMTQLHRENGEMCPVTAIEIGPCPVLSVKTTEGRDGYNAVKLGFCESKNVSKPEKGIAAAAGVPGVKFMREFRVDNSGEFETGSILTAGLFEIGEKVMVHGTTKGRGFAGVTKRHRFKGGDATHGCRAKRIPGSIGASSDPSRVFKGKKMPGHYGVVRHTVKGLEIIMVDTENNVIFVKGAVPGPSKGLVCVTKQP